MASDAAAFRDRVAAVVPLLSDEVCFIHYGISGTALQPPTPERLREQAQEAGGWQRQCMSRA
jgi:hypothetical protein